MIKWSIICVMLQDRMVLSCLSWPLENGYPRVPGGIGKGLSDLDRQHQGKGTNCRAHLSLCVNRKKWWGE